MGGWNTSQRKAGSEEKVKKIYILKLRNDQHLGERVTKITHSWKVKNQVHHVVARANDVNSQFSVTFKHEKEGGGAAKKHK